MLWRQKMKPEMRYKCHCSVSMQHLRSIFPVERLIPRRICCYLQTARCYWLTRSFRFSYGNQSDCGQVHEKRGSGRQQNATDYAHLCPIEWVGDDYGKARAMAAMPILSRENPCVVARRYCSSELSSFLSKVQAGNTHWFTTISYNTFETVRR